MDKFTQIIDNVFTPEECKIMIEKYSIDVDHDNYSDYNFKDILNFDDILPKLMNTIGQYITKNPEINLVASKFGLMNFRFKHFKPGSSFNDWHSEHCLTYPDRVLSVQIYLSNHRCGTEFYNNECIESKIGRVAIFPAYFTHTHRGQTCPDNKDRYIITSYVSFYEKGDKELNNA